MFVTVEVLVGVLILFIVTLSLGVFLRFLFEDVRLSTAVLFFRKFIYLPLMPFMIYYNRKSILMKVKHTKSINDEMKERIENILVSRRSVLLFFINYYRIFLDVLVMEAVRYDKIAKRKRNNFSYMDLFTGLFKNDSGVMRS